MVKVSAEIVQDAISKNGRLVAISWKTDDDIVNKLLVTPRIFRKTFPININDNAILAHFKNDIKTAVKSVKKQLKEEGLGGKKLEFEV